jgi:hypothetical protein
LIRLACYKHQGDDREVSSLVGMHEMRFHNFRPRH